MSYSLRSKGPASANMTGTTVNPSTESSSSTATQDNLFESFLTSENDDREPTLRELKAMLMAIMKKMMKVDDLNSDVEIIKKQQQEVITDVKICTERVVAVEKRQDSIEDRCNAALKQLQVPIIGNEYNNKQYNILLYNLPAVEVNERPKTTKDEVKKVLKDVLKIENVDSIPFASVHRLPAQPDKRQPIIARLRSKFDKQIIWDNIRKLNDYNDKQISDSTKIFIEMNHLPYKLQQDKKSLIDKFKTAKKGGKEPKWYFSKKTAEFGYKIGTVFYRPENNFVTVPTLEQFNSIAT